MRSYALIENGVCTNTVVAEAAFVESVDDDYVLLSENSLVAIDWTYDAATRTFTEPDAELLAPEDIVTELAATEI